MKDIMICILLVAVGYFCAHVGFNMRRIDKKAKIIDPNIPSGKSAAKIVDTKDPLDNVEI